MDSRRSGEDRIRSALHVPVLTAAAASVPAVFLTRLDGPVSLFGSVLNWSSMLVLTAESVLLFWFSRDRPRWLREHWWMALVTVLTIPAVVFAFAPAQVLRLVRVVAAVQLVRVFRLVKVARVLHRRSRVLGRPRYALLGAVLLAAVVLLGVVLADEDSPTRRTLDAVSSRWGWPVLLGVVVLFAAAIGGLVTWLRRRRDERSERGR
ncbi:hypothetical protein SAMN04487904_1123 [Actinopolyspora lacussalsi subsp. righensis]|uniref:Voltage-gated potassium channel n=1 Tax=Actinopolyspora righensis TaxID=995060 RepID=A0A1I7BMZ4_9ACTN|nr:hypothetical protein [Actinopolyspora righensis]SFT88451.1 hypothetical protein SAMN04487904_1123 [Actinopolyspora righensis]